MSETQSIVEKLLSTKVRDIPPGFSATFNVDGYRVKLDFDEQYGVQIVVRRAREGDGEDSNVEIYDPNPELTIGDIVIIAKQVIEMLVKKQ
jgi:hypothetical protein